jgi:photosystem II stability/assembly factor-like uncharacterized protein
MKYALVALTILFLVACGGTQESRTKTSSPEPFSVISKTPTVFASATHTPIPITKTPNSLTGTPHPSPTPRLNTPLEPGTGMLLTSIQMFDSQTGWGFDSDYHILRTRDGGKTWQDVTPPSGYYSSSGFFALDAHKAWATFTIGLYSNPRAAHVWRTENGGDTWARSQEIDLDLDERGEPYASEFYLPQGMQFIDRQTGWLLSAVSYKMNSVGSLFFQTTDGGNTWRTINSQIGLPDDCIAIGFAFVDPQAGWAGGHCFIQKPVFTPMQSMFAEGGWFLGKTLDGGRSFEERTILPVPAELREAGMLAASGNCGELRLLPIGDDMVGIEWGCSIFPSLKPEHRFFTFSSDGGQTWTSWKSTGNEFFLNANHGWRLFSPGELQQTTDGGSNWITIKHVTWEDAKFDFVSEQEGWAIASIGQARILLYSVNGGRTWADLHPIIGP